MPNFESWFKELHPEIAPRSAEAVLRLTAEGGTIPFIARYRKEQTGNLDEVGIQKVIEAKERWDQTLKRQTFIVEEIDRQKKLTPELKERILATFDLNLLEDIYLPYKQKRKSKAAQAREAGLEPLADWIWNVGHGTETPQPGQTLEIWAFTFRNEEKGVADAAKAIEGAQDILIERLSEAQELRQQVRDAVFKRGGVSTTKGAKPKPNSKFENYFEHSEPVEALLKPENSHRYLAMRRGWMEEELTLNIGGKPGDTEFEAGLLAAFEGAACSAEKRDSDVGPVLLKSARMALKVHVLPSIESEAHKALRDVADEVAIRVFAENVKKLLLASPFGPKAVLGVDPGLRTGCKLAVVDDSGAYVASTVIHLHSDDQKTKAKAVIAETLKNAPIRAIAVGNGTAGRETERFLRQAVKEAGVENVPVVMVSESGASVYSASDVAREEFPELDVTVRGAISIARRLQDPLAELVKIEPKAIGVGQYQHDVSQHALKKSLELVVDSCVNQVGVNLNTASNHLLAHVAGIGPGLAKAIVEHRGAKGLFKARTELMEVPRFSQKTFEQAAGFLRIPEGENPLDNTGVHPERYAVIETHARKLGKSVKDLLGAGARELRKDQEFKKELGEFTFKDIVDELEKPGRDPREEFVPFQFRDDIHEVKDLQPQMICPGIVTNVTNFGAFVDIGVHQDGLVHISQISDKYVKDPREAVSPGDRVQVKVLEVNLAKNQISLTMKTGRSELSSRSRSDNKPERAERAPREEKPRENRGGDRQRHQPKAPPRPQPSGAKPAFGPGAAPSNRGGGQQRPAPKPQPAFNNAFAGLAALKSSLKPK